MRAAAVAVGVLVLGGVAARDVLAQAADPAAIVAQARQALGGDARLGAVRTVIVNGRTRQVRGDNLVPIEFDIQIELPDRYARRDEFPAQDAGPATSGFSGETLIQLPPSPAPAARPGGPPPPSPEQQQALNRARVTTIKQDFARLMLGLFVTTPSSFPVTFAYAGQAEAPQGKADALDAKGPESFAARLFIDAQSHLPIMLTWQQAAPPPRRGGPPPQTAAAAGGAPPQATPPAAPPAVEHRLYFADFREVDGLKWPFRLRHAVAGDTIEETTVDRYRINARIDPKRFDPGK